jgi:hypothetical protein
MRLSPPMEGVMGSLSKCHAWEQTLDLLARVSSKSANSGGCDEAEVRLENYIPLETRRARAAECGMPRSALVSILERCSPKSVSICWCDATSGRYGDQLWRLRVARGKTICALSGAVIRRGDLVYRPSVRGRCPANADQSISAEELEKWERGAIEPNASNRGRVASSGSEEKKGGWSLRPA